MPNRPGVNISISEAPPALTQIVSSGAWFVSGLAEKGPTTSYQKVTSLNEFKRYFGDRVSYGYLYDAADVFFREGGSFMYATRIVGPAAVTAFFNLVDGSAVATLKISAKNPGAWGNALNVQVIAGTQAGYFILVITHDVLGELERSPELADKQAAIDWSQGSIYVTATDIATTNDPAVVAAQSLATGADDQVGITDTQWTNSLNNFPRDLGPGQVSFPGRLVNAGYTALMNHAAVNNRVAILDGPNTNVKSTITTVINAIVQTNSKYSAMFGPWLTTPGITPGTIRTLPPSPMVCGLIAKTDALKGTANAPAAGSDGIPKYVTKVAVDPFLDSDRQDLSITYGFDPIIMKNGRPRIYGWRTLASSVTDPNWINLGNVRLIMEIAAKADVIGEEFMFDEIDGQNRLITRWGGALTGMLMPYYEAGSLFGASPAQAFVVDVGPSVNTPQSLANLELRAAIAVRPSPFAEMITIEVVKQRIDQSL